MREKPTLRIPFGVLLLLGGLALYAGLVLQLAPWIGQQPVWLQTAIYLVLGIAWLLPLRRFLIWMETGRWS
ncbi:hypothetical protein PK98_05265 [Croceibacterium mercuriale]|uniref:DUF2842 domain-containing protein n=1 Tax=Croceibacterium mercuriale TaxID=1572751 RepID=A0A0B2C1B3_9SPHN|nr:DUF2842 domain-containing protein [Croceibacterium mercuriale]KHL25975.1 hypothetical protein PK98_05265 [Croceibacterium mercuriale]